LYEILCFTASSYFLLFHSHGATSLVYIFVSFHQQQKLAIKEETKCVYTCWYTFDIKNVIDFIFIFNINKKKCVAYPQENFLFTILHGTAKRLKKLKKTEKAQFCSKALRRLQSCANKIWPVPNSIILQGLGQKIKLKNVKKNQFTVLN
jgi:hypothetical protein